MRHPHSPAKFPSVIVFGGDGHRTPEAARAAFLVGHHSHVFNIAGYPLVDRPDHARHRRPRPTRTQVGRTNPAEIVFIRPARRATDARPAPLPDLPHAAGRFAPLTLEVVTRQHSGKGATHRTRHAVARTVDRIHMAFADGREWLFERNPLDPRRLSGQLIVHGTRTIVLHEESDLRNRLGLNGWAERNRLGLNGWADVLLLNLDPGVVSQLKPTGRTRTIGGVRFVNQTLQGRKTRTSDVWWSDEYALPGAFDVRDETGSTRVSVERLRAGVDAEVLQPPSLRFPQYKVVDLAEWLEGH